MVTRAGNYSPQTRRHVGVYQRNSARRAWPALVQAAGRPRQGRQSSGRPAESPSRQKAGSVAAALAGDLRVAFELLAQRRKAGPAERAHDHRRRQALDRPRRESGDPTPRLRRVTARSRAAPCAPARGERGSRPRAAERWRRRAWRRRNSGSPRRPSKRFELRQPHRLRLSAEGGNQARQGGARAAPRARRRTSCASRLA